MVLAGPRGPLSTRSLAAVGRPRGLRRTCRCAPARHSHEDLRVRTTRARAAPGAARHRVLAAGRRPLGARWARPSLQTPCLVAHQSLDTESNVFREVPQLYLARWFVRQPSAPEPASERTGRPPDPSPTPRARPRARVPQSPTCELQTPEAGELGGRPGARREKAERAPAAAPESGFSAPSPPPQGARWGQCAR